MKNNTIVAAEKPKPGISPKMPRPRKKPREHAFRNRLVISTKFDDPEIFDKEMTFLISLFAHVLIDIQNSLPQGVYRLADLQQDLLYLNQKTSGEGLHFMCRLVPDLVASFMCYVETGESVYPKQFSLKPGCLYPNFLSGLIGRIYRGDCSCEVETDLVRHIYQLGALFKKLRGPYGRDVVVEFVDKFVATDKSLVHTDLFDPELEDLVAHARTEITKVFAGLSPYDPYTRGEFVPRPGPGSTANKTPSSSRYSPTVIHTSVDKHLPYREWFYNTLGDVIDDIELFKQLHISAREYPISRFALVFKYFGKPRGICLEENEVQVLQQAFRRALYTRCESHIFTRGRLVFDNQEIFKKLALAASASQEFSTLDMSEGSDRVWRMLVFQMFLDTELLPYLMALSTPYISIKDAKSDIDLLLECEKFAPMGSALCFPVMGIVHYFLCRAIIAKKLPRKYKKLTNKVFVYGDDIIVPYEATEAIMMWLPKFGMKFNVNKSFTHSIFRESCGIHAYGGVDITPIYVRDVVHKHHSPISSLASTIAAEYGLYRRKYYGAAEWLRNHVHQVLGEVLPEVWRESSLVGWWRDDRCDITKLRCRTRSSSDLQCEEFRVRVLKTREKRSSLHAYSGLLRWLWQQPRSPVKVCKHFVDPTVEEDSLNQIKWVWKPLSAL